MNFKTKTIKKVKVYDENNKLIGYYKNKESSNKYKVYSKGILIDVKLGEVNSDDKAMKLIRKQYIYENEL